MNATTPAQPNELPSRRVPLAKGPHASPPPPTVADAPDAAEPGRGLQLVAALSAEWGWGR